MLTCGHAKKEFETPKSIKEARDCLLKRSVLPARREALKLITYIL
ncbi:MAG: hypothetical protein UV67_C0017G0015 [Parcubacteria group bacterium GW2011_GWC1_43_12]|nr:MAG: hypothetical protein UV34_C0039G0004 [Parcubacteria group bacterium GW2011_GWB1_42_6]KKS91820.1 MAG: hypothetical protein UV67_C0017G0015 [Parcubacteria group bacterium GW2011_GWC1_43_12]